MKKTNWMLVATGLALFVLSLVFEYSEVMKGMSWVESGFLFVTVLLFALYRPAWAFLLLIVFLPLETFSLLPEGSGLRLRPYQMITVALYGALLIRFGSGRLPVGRFRLTWIDWTLLLFGLSSFAGAALAIHPGQSFKQAIIVGSFLALYLLVRYFVRSERDMRHALPYFAVSSFMVFGFALWQSIRRVLGQESFEVMVGRPNSTFSEADWLGAFMVLLFALVMTMFAPKRHGEEFLREEFTPARVFGWIALISTTFLLALTVARSAWLAAGVVFAGFLSFVGILCLANREACRESMLKVGEGLLCVLMGVGLASVSHLTPFSLGQRAVSTGGWQTITIACAQPQALLPPPMIQSVDELAQYDCRFITLEEVSAEEEQGNEILTVKRPDPNVSTRSMIYAKVKDVLKGSPLSGIGWGNIGDILGRDGNGNSLNASNIFLEVWLGAGLVGLLAFSAAWWGIGVLYVVLVWREMISHVSVSDERGVSPLPLGMFMVLSWCGLTVFNLFNSGIFLGFLWVWLAVATSGLAMRTKSARELTK